MASDGRTNLRSRNKLRALTEKFGERGFDYAGNSSADFAVWVGARHAIVVNASKSVTAHAAGCATVEREFPPGASTPAALWRCLRPHQWVKNLLVFVPALAAHQLTDAVAMQRAAWAFGVFCLCASGVYVLNDLMDLDADRQHALKRRRPFAAGQLPIPTGLAISAGLLLAGLLAAIELSWLFAGVTAAYLVLTTSYSWRLKSIALLDVFVLAGLYTIRLLAGSAASGIPSSSWLLIFSIFIFLSLALVKRYVELYNSRNGGATRQLGGRGYSTDDLEMVASLGAGSGYLAALVLALYVDSQKVVTLYAHPNVLLILCPLLLYWISHVWLLAHRGRMHDDPVLFAVKDGVSYFIGALALAVLWLAARP
jgi:4-hydroxybenzoate polyprenyltransferase